MTVFSHKTKLEQGSADCFIKLMSQQPQYSGCPASRKSQKFNSQVGRVGNGRKLTIEVGKREEKQRSITRPTAFADSKAIVLFIARSVP